MHCSTKATFSNFFESIVINIPQVRTHGVGCGMAEVLIDAVYESAITLVDEEVVWLDIVIADVDVLQSILIDVKYNRT